MRWIVIILFGVLLGHASLSQPSPLNTTTPPPTNVDQRDPDKMPLVVNALLPPKTAQETAEGQEDRKERASSDWWMVHLTGLIAAIGAGQGLVFWVQANRLKATIKKMDEIASVQAADMGNSIKQATRAATAMERLSESTAGNVATVTEMARNQREFWQMQMRAYVTVRIGGAVYQEREKNLRFEGKPMLLNTGHTPAHNVRHRIKADILPVPLAKDLNWELPVGAIVDGTVVGPGQDRILSGIVQRQIFDGEVDDIKAGKGRALCVWGTVNYDDVFGVKHFTNFCQMLTWQSDNKIYGFYNHEHNDGD